jgi:hypothetical protein
MLMSSRLGRQTTRCSTVEQRSSRKKVRHTMADIILSNRDHLATIARAQRNQNRALVSALRSVLSVSRIERERLTIDRSRAEQLVEQMRADGDTDIAAALDRFLKSRI